MVGVRMLSTKLKRRIGHGDRAIECVAEIRSFITALANNDLSDLAGIFKAEPCTPIGNMAFREMARRNISL